MHHISLINGVVKWDMDDFEEVEYPPKLPAKLELKNSSQRKRHEPVDEQFFTSICDPNGRIINEPALREAVFRGGIEKSLRRKIWPLLFDVYSFSSTEREREALLADYCAKYNAMKQRWKIVLRSHHDKKIYDPCYLKVIPDPSASECKSSSAQLQTQCLLFQAQVFAGRQEFDLDRISNSVRIIDKDVPRTDRNTEYFKGDTNVHLRMLRDILVTYAAFHPEVGYVQGMNDIAGRFLVVTDSEEVTYWCLVKYMDHMKQDFIEDGMLNKLKLVRELLSEMDPDLLRYLDGLCVGDLTFCHRWMLLSFKREFEVEEGLQCFEILSSRHLETSSTEAQRTQEGETQRDFEAIGGTNRVVAAPSMSEYSFEVFMCAAILMLYREQIFQGLDTSDVFCLVNSLTMKLNLHEILEKAENLFYSHCKKSVTDCFQVVEIPSPENEYDVQSLDRLIASTEKSSPTKSKEASCSNIE